MSELMIILLVLSFSASIGLILVALAVRRKNVAAAELADWLESLGGDDDS